MKSTPVRHILEVTKPCHTYRHFLPPGQEEQETCEGKGWHAAESRGAGPPLEGPSFPSGQ